MSFYADLDAAKRTVARLEQEFADAKAVLAALQAQAVSNGIDVSQFNGSVDWPKTGAGFAFVRTSDGDIRDTAYNAARVDALRAAGIPFSPYHFGRVASSGNGERDGRVEAGMSIYFAHSAGWGKTGDLPLAYDFETLNGQTPAKAAQHVVQFCKAYEFIKQHRPIIYTNPATWLQVLAQFSPASLDLLSGCPLWIAHWDVANPTIPAPWSDWTFWQYSDKGTVPGITGAVDLNRFSGSATDLQSLRIA